MVREVVDDLDTVFLALELLSPRDAAEGDQALADLVRSESAEARRRCGHRRVADIEFAGHRHGVAFASEDERTTRLVVFYAGDAEGVFLAEANGRHRTGRFLRYVEAVFLIAVHEGHAVARDDVEEAFEAQLDLLDVVVDIRVVELDVVHHHAFGQVVEELGALVEEGRVVFIAFEDVDVGVREMRSAAKVFRQAADHETGIAPGVPKQPRQHRGGGRFPVRAADDEVPLPAQEMLLHHLGKGVVEQLAVERRLCFGVAAGDRVADHHHVGSGRDVFLTISLGDGDALAAQEI